MTPTEKATNLFLNEGSGLYDLVNENTGELLSYLIYDNGTFELI